MKKYNITIRIKETFEVEAENYEEAYDKGEEMLDQLTENQADYMVIEEIEISE